MTTVENVGLVTLLHNHMQSKTEGVYVVLHPEDTTDIYWDIIQVIGPLSAKQGVGVPFAVEEKARAYTGAGKSGDRGLIFRYNAEDPWTPLEGGEFEFDLWVDGTEVNHRDHPNSFIYALVGKAMGATVQYQKEKK